MFSPFLLQTVIGDLPFRHDNDTLVVSCADDRDLLKQYTAWHEQVVSPEYVLTGALKQELDFAAYKLTKFGTTPMKIKQAASSQHASPIAAVVAPKRGGRAAAKKGGA